MLGLLSAHKRTPNLHFHTLLGILDQGLGVLVVFDDSSVDQTYTAALKTIANTSKVVDSLYTKSKQLQ